MHDIVQDYYGHQLQHSGDLKTSAYCRTPVLPVTSTSLATSAATMEFSRAAAARYPSIRLKALTRPHAAEQRGGKKCVV